MSGRRSIFLTASTPSRNSTSSRIGTEYHGADYNESGDCAWITGNLKLCEIVNWIALVVRGRRDAKFPRSPLLVHHDIREIQLRTCPRSRFLANFVLADRRSTVTHLA